MTENLAARGEGLKGLVAKWRKEAEEFGKIYKETGRDSAFRINAIRGTCADELEAEIAALEAAAPAGTAHDVHWAIKADCQRCRESYPQRHDKPGYIPNFGNVEAGDWTHPCTAEHDWRYCQAAKIHEALFAAALATPSPQAPQEPPRLAELQELVREWRDSIGTDCIGGVLCERCHERQHNANALEAWLVALSAKYGATLRPPAWRVEELRCKAQKTADPPQDCDWPTCGCDPHADKVIEALQESGKL